MARKWVVHGEPLWGLIEQGWLPVLAWQLDVPLWQCAMWNQTVRNFLVWYLRLFGSVL